MIDDLDGDFAGGGEIEGVTLGGIERRPSLFVNFRLQRFPQFFIRFIGSGKIGVPDKETLAVVIRVDEPASDFVGGIASHFPGRGIVNM